MNKTMRSIIRCYWRLTSAFLLPIKETGSLRKESGNYLPASLGFTQQDFCGYGNYQKPG